MLQPLGAFPLFSWFTARLVSSRLGGSQLTGASTSRTASSSPGNSRSGPYDATPRSREPNGPGSPIPRQCRARAISCFNCRTAGPRPKGSQRPDSSVGKSSQLTTSGSPLSRRHHGLAPPSPSSPHVVSRFSSRYCPVLLSSLDLRLSSKMFRVSLVRNLQDFGFEVSPQFLRIAGIFRFAETFASSRLYS